jgi:hypothetical protein
MASGAAVLALTTVMWPSAASAAPSDNGPGLVLHTYQSTYAEDETVRLAFVVTNAGDHPCGLAKTPDGSVQITSVRRDGQELAPVLARGFYEDGLDATVRNSLATTAPGSTVDVTLTAVRVTGGTVLRSVADGPDGGALDSLWPVGDPGRYEVTASYAVPPVGGTVTPCAGVSGARTVAFTVGSGGTGMPWLWIGVAGAGLVVLAALMLLLLLRRRWGARQRGPRGPGAGRASAAAALVLLALLGATAVASRPAYADYEVDPNRGIQVPGDFKGAVAACMAKFDAPGGDPSGLLKRLKDPKTPKVTIIPTTGGSDTFETPLGPAGKGSSVITWNPTSTDPYEDGVARDPCSALYHELNHADDISKDTVPQGDCGDTGIKTAEVKATLAENRYRKAQGLDQRKQYGGHDLPKSLDDCNKPKKKTPPPKGPTRLCEDSNQCGSTNGDPHLVTFDRAYYDFQAVGEFVVARSTTGDGFEVQSRQAPMGQSRTVSVNSALAFRVSSSTVDIMLAGGVTQVHIDHQLVDLARGPRSLPGGGTLERRESDIGRADGYEVGWPDGSEAAVDQIGAYGYRLLMRLAAGRAGKVQGLFGNFDGDPTNDIAPPTGPALAQPVPFDKLYPSYADSWRVAAGSSLFTYEAGQSTDAFTDRRFPDKPVTVADLDAARRAQAETICRWAGVTDAWQFQECVLDVGVTGRSEFAVSSATSELIAPPVAAPIAAPPMASGTLTAGAADRVSFAGRAGQAVFVDITAPTVKDSCSPYALLDPAGKHLNGGCNINGSGYIERTELTADGQYSLIIEPNSIDTGRATVRVYLAHDTDETLEPNGPYRTVTLDQPGSVARLRFTGTGGQRVFVDVPASTLPDQCSPLKLLDAAGRMLNGGCVINGDGDIEGTVLPADGAYTVVVDPSGRTTGAADVRLYSARDGSGTIVVNGPPVVATIGQPGFLMRYTFAGTAGTTVSLSATGATLPDQCSPVKLVDPVGQLVSDTCVINGTGSIPKAVLPSTGTYAVVVDPNGSATGSVTVTLSSSA